MSRSLLFTFLFITSLVFSQERVIEIDYVVDYTIPSKGNKTIDTISIGFDKNGKYLWTNYNELALGLAKSMLKNSSEDFVNAKSNIIFNTEDGTLTLVFELNKNLIYFNLSLDSFIPVRRSNGDENSLDLITENTGETIKVLGKDVKVYNMFPSENPDDVITMATDKDYNVNNNQIFKKIFEIAFQKSGLEDESMPNIPSGLIMKVIENNNTMIEAIKVNDKKKTIKINYSFKITE
ncbi:hypothetical protein [Winogradskyella sp. UBA3174]|uniref:hypothetical protein n=1 Tax=Winogradskyella sp. UBA3174 TaxID=1947785 RepID=UPI0025D14DFD|nr:hypothetical protein [Winogradskyella sp. UBA3174]|tara:strand:- start:23984 stop:24691 length:708 start_codon:yes stop_codon:yes gene_type:complete